MTATAHYPGPPFVSVPCEVRIVDPPRGYRGRQDGYGSRIPSSRMVRLNGRWRRVYVCCWSNSGTAYVRTDDGAWITFSGL